MTTIRILHHAGVGDWPMGATVEVDDRRAQRLILVGYARAVSPPQRPDDRAKRTRKKETH